MSGPDARDDEGAGGEVQPSRRLRAFDGDHLRRLAAEFLIIVVGVLVAFAVDDWQTRVESRAEAVRVLELMEADMATSVEDLREAGSSAKVRRDAIVELMRRAGSPLPNDGAWTPWDEVDFSEMRGAVITQLGQIAGDTLTMLPIYVQVFDPRTAAFDELRNTGGLATIPDPAVRQEIMEYFAAILDFAESNAFLRADQFALQDAWQKAGIVASDWIPTDEFMRRLRASPDAMAALRRNYARARDQASGYPMLADSLEARGARILERARASLER